MRLILTSLLLLLAVTGCAGPSAQPTSDAWASHSGYGGHVDNGGAGRFQTGGIMGGSMSDDRRRMGGGGPSTTPSIDVIDLRDTTGKR